MCCNLWCCVTGIVKYASEYIRRSLHAQPLTDFRTATPAEPLLCLEPQSPTRCGSASVSFIALDQHLRYMSYGGLAHCHKSAIRCDV